MSHAWPYGESSLDKWPIIDSNKSKAYPGTILMIKYWGEDEYNLFGFDFEAGDERSWGVVQRRGIFLALQTLPHDILSKLHYQLGLFTLFLKIYMVLDMFQIGLYLLWHKLFWGLDYLTELRGGQSGEGSLLNIEKIGTLGIEWAQYQELPLVTNDRWKMMDWAW